MACHVLFLDVADVQRAPNFWAYIVRIPNLTYMVGCHVLALETSRFRSCHAV